MTTRYDRLSVGREMARQGIGPRELAPKAKLSPQAVSYIARGMVDPRASTLAQLASALGVSIRRFFIAEQN